MEIEIDVTCNECENSLDIREVWRGGRIEYHIKPCEKCLENARKEGEEAGREEGDE